MAKNDFDNGFFCTQLFSVMLHACVCMSASCFPLSQIENDKRGAFKQWHTYKARIVSKWESHRHYSNICTDRQLYIILIYQIFYIAMPCICIIFTGDICDLIIAQDMHTHM